VIVFPDVDGESAYPAMMKRFLPAGLMGVMVASFLGAFMSTIDTHLNLSSAYIVNDVYRRFVRKHAPERHYVLVSRIASVCFVILGSAIALVSESISGLFVFLLAFTSGFGLVLVLRWFWWRINAWSEISAMVASGVISSLLYVLKSSLPPPRLEWLSAQGVLALTVAGSTVVWLAVTFLTPPVSAEKLAAFYRKVRPYGAWGRIAAESGVRPPSGLGWMILNWLAGSVMVLAATLGLGKLLLGFHREGAAYVAAAAAAAVLVCLGLARADGQRGERPSPGGGRAATAV
jgi:SSS family solute:Na+ symporter